MTARIDATADVEVGQVWVDNDPRRKGRTVLVVRVGATHALCRVLANGEATRVRLDRFRPTSAGYRLAERQLPSAPVIEIDQP